MHCGKHGSEYARHFRNNRSIGGRVMTNPTTLEDFEAIELRAEETGIFLRRFGLGPAVLLLHGFPQTHLMWRFVAPLLARRFTVICADLRGYGRSGCPVSGPDHAPYAKRRSEEHTSELQSRENLVCRLLLEKKKNART